MAGGAERTLAILVTAKDLASNTLKSVGKNIGGLGKRASTGLKTAAGNVLKIGTAAAIATAGIGFGAVKIAADFDAAMTESLAIVQGVTPQIRAEMEKVARDTSKKLGVSAEDAARSYFFLASAGFDAQQQLAAMPKVLTFAKAGAFDAALATDLLTDAQSALGLTVRDNVTKNMENLTRVSDVLVRTNTLANTSVQQISEAMTNKAGAAARNLGKDVEETAAILAAFADQGVKGAAAGESLNIVWRDLQRAAIKNEKGFKSQRIAVFDAAGEMRNTADIVGDLERALEGMSDKQKRATLTSLGFQDKSVSNLMTLLGTSKAIRGYEKELRNAGGATQEVADKQLGSFNEQLQILRRYVEDAGITIGSKLIPKLVPLAKRAVGFIDAHQDDIERFGDQLAGAFDTAAEFAATIPWGEVANGLKIAAGFAGNLITAFTSMPPEAQGIILALAGLDKLSGGAIHGIAGELAKGAIKGILGMNAGVVNLRAAVVNGGVGAGAGGAGAAAAGGLLSKAKFLGGVALSGAALVGILNDVWTNPDSEIAKAVKGMVPGGGATFTDIQQQANTNATNTQSMIASGDTSKMVSALEGMRKDIEQLPPLQKALYELNASGVKTNTEEMQRALEDAINSSVPQDSLTVQRDALYAAAEAEARRRDDSRELKDALNAGYDELVNANRRTETAINRLANRPVNVTVQSKTTVSVRSVTNTQQQLARWGSKVLALS